MQDASADERASNQRMGISRFFVPHQSFDWFSRSIALTVLGSGGFLATSWWIYHRRLMEALGILDAGYPEMMSEYTRLSLMGTGIVVVAAGIYITLMAGFLFHRVAGPIYRLHNHMQDLLDGKDVSELRFRTTDQLGDLCDTYNQLLHHLDALEPKTLDEVDPPQT